jgi:two-component system sensor kinase FixL
VLGRSYDFLFDRASDGDDLPGRLLEIARSDGSFRDRCWRLRKDGSRFRADVMIARIEGDALLPSGFGQVLRDVTNEEFQARSLEANAVLLRSILETVPEGLVVTDIAGNILLFSAAAEAMFGYASREVVGHNVAILLPERDRPAHEEYMKHYRSIAQTHTIGTRRRLIGRRKDGSEFPHTLRLAEASGGGQRMIASFIQDLTEKEAASAKLEELQRELAHISRVYEMSTLASTIAHELNQPLMAVVNFVQTSAELLRKGDPDHCAALTEAMEEAGRETLRAGDILRRLRAFLSRGDLEKTREDPGQLARDAIYFEAARARYRNIACDVECTPDLRPVLVERVQIQQVILNLVKNAVQSIGEDGKVCVIITSEPGQLRVTVSDSGPGVPSERIARLFEPFSTSKTDGMGLGLPICRSIIEAHGGRIWHEPAPGGGASFIFTLPQFAEESKDAQ